MTKRMVCEDCGHEFMAEVGGEGSVFEIYRCDDCDRVLKAEKVDDMPDVLMESCGCGGTYWKGRPPKCPDCRSSNIKVMD